MNKTYCCSDLHGMLPLWQQIQNFCDETDTIYVLGDAADRGSNSWETLKEVLKDSRVKYIRGNHDQMLLDAWRNEWQGDEFYLWLYNGGGPTFENLITDENHIKYLSQLAKTKIYECYENKNKQRIHLSHAGFTLLENDEIPSKEELLWDRDHIQYQCSWWIKDNPKDYIVHGHTPIVSKTFKLASMFNPEDYDFNICKTMVKYVKGHKICIDAGCFATGKIALLDLDTLTEKTFEIENFVL